MGQSKSGSLPKALQSARCPICGAPAVAATHPFCSVHCADVDLSRWLRGTYAIPGGQQDADEDGDDTQAEQRPGDHTLAPGDDEE